MYFEIEKELFDAFIDKLPEALDENWELSCKNDISDPICKDYFIYDYKGDKFKHLSMFIQRLNVENPNKHIVTIKPIEKSKVEDTESELIYTSLKDIFYKFGVLLKM